MVALMRLRSNTATPDEHASEVPDALTLWEPARKEGSRRQRRLTELQIEELVSSRLQGEEIDLIAERFGVHRNTVMAHLARRSVPGRRWPGRVLTSDELALAGELYQSGASLLVVGEHFGVDRRYLRRVLPELGFAIRRPGQQKRS